MAVANFDRRDLASYASFCGEALAGFESYADRNERDFERVSAVAESGEIQVESEAE